MSDNNIVQLAIFALGLIVVLLVIMKNTASRAKSVAKKPLREINPELSHQVSSIEKQLCDLVEHNRELLARTQNNVQLLEILNDRAEQKIRELKERLN